MTWEAFVVYLGVCGTVFGIYNIVQSRKRTHEQDCRDDGRESGAILTEIGYVKSGVDDIKRKQGEQEKQHIKVIRQLTAVESSTRQAHHRIDRLEGKDER